jgi:L-seryl-tRNA(Ser) seleniumtransferase
VDRVLSSEAVRPLLARFRRELVAAHCRAVLGARRRAIRDGTDAPDDEHAIAEAVAASLERARQARLTRVINATGTVLHTNLGRAPLAEAAIAALTMAARDAVDLEYDVESGERGQREARLEALLTKLTGAEAATVVNNNAAAVLLALNTLGSGRQVVVSRGELVEIGGSFRVPEVMEKSGARLREVGSTNRTHPEDYERAIDETTALLLKVHTSNYRIVGFSSEVDLAALVEIGRRRGIPVMEDLGSGALIDLSRHGLPKEPVVAERVACGADVVTFSGDKVLGGPQAGLIVGRRDLIGRIAGNPMHRALRCGKLTVAALEATLRLYLESPDIVRDIPALAAFARPTAELERVGALALDALGRALGADYQLSLEDSTSQIGSGALPADEIATKVIAVRSMRESAAAIAAGFRAARPPIIGRIRDGTFLLDLRTITDPEDLVPKRVRATGGL